jgi:RsiW-degrading membrane proteinase PrsW (M82 family)
MNKFFLVVRAVLLVALLFLLASVFWGLANRESTEAHDGTELYERYQKSKPAGYTSVLLIVLVVLGIFIVLLSTFFEYHQYRRGSSDTGPHFAADDQEKK